MIMDTGNIMNFHIAISESNKSFKIFNNSPMKLYIYEKPLKGSKCVLITILEPENFIVFQSDNIKLKINELMFLFRELHEKCTIFSRK